MFFYGSLVEGTFEETAFLDLDGDGSLVEMGEGGLVVFDSLEAAFFI